MWASGRAVSGVVLLLWWRPAEPCAGPKNVLSLGRASASNHVTRHHPTHEACSFMHLHHIPDRDISKSFTLLPHAVVQAAIAAYHVISYSFTYVHTRWVGDHPPWRRPAASDLVNFYPGHILLRLLLLKSSARKHPFMRLAHSRARWRFVLGSKENNPCMRPAPLVSWRFVLANTKVNAILTFSNKFPDSNDSILYKTRSND